MIPTTEITESTPHDTRREKKPKITPATGSKPPSPPLLPKMRGQKKEEYSGKQTDALRQKKSPSRFESHLYTSDPSVALLRPCAFSGERSRRIRSSERPRIAAAHYNAVMPRKDNPSSMDTETRQDNGASQSKHTAVAYRSRNTWMSASAI